MIGIMSDWKKELQNPCCGLARDMMRDLMPASKEEWENLSCKQLRYFLMQESERGATRATEILEAWNKCEAVSNTDNMDIYGHWRGKNI